MAVEDSAEVLRLRAMVRDLLALSSIPEVWVGRAPPTVAAELADLMIHSLQLDFAFVRLCEPGSQASEVVRGDGGRDFPEWLRQRIAVGSEHSRTEEVTDIGGGGSPRRGIGSASGVGGH